MDSVRVCGWVGGWVDVVCECVCLCVCVCARAHVGRQGAGGAERLHAVPARLERF